MILNVPDLLISHGCSDLKEDNSDIYFCTICGQVVQNNIIQKNHPFISWLNTVTDDWESEYSGNLGIWFDAWMDGFKKRIVA